MIKLFAGLVLACLVTPAWAQPVHNLHEFNSPEIPESSPDHIPGVGTMVADSCVPADAVMAKLRADGDTVTGPFPAPGAHIDALYIDLDANGVYLWASKDGCIVPPPMHLDLPPGAAPKPTVLHGRGVEIGV